ncbi:uncharacterized protein LOC119673014 [Teleopsis dalmanni]|uniref:uncharacterized protein LOC119673014 n=1 Tax=Teleopsis dalmanni TaxID=139649 RepID=UPI0018CD79C6|nr:uncharacterized protein LOC119673014 [Teleopsis dalmanni]
MNRYFVCAYFAAIFAVVNCSLYGGIGGYGAPVLGGYGNPNLVGLALHAPSPGAPLINPIAIPRIINSYPVSYAPSRSIVAPNAAKSASAAAASSVAGRPGAVIGRHAPYGSVVAPYGVPLGSIY